MHDSTSQYFYELTPESILDAVEQIGVRCTGRALPLNSMENRVYEVEIEVDPSEITSRYDSFRVVKFYRPGRWTRQQIEEEHRFLLELEEEDIPVAAPLRLPGGGTLGSLAASGILYSVFPKVGGRHADELTQGQLEVLGRLLARMHAVGVRSDAASRLNLDVDTYGRGNLEAVLASGTIPSNFVQHYRSTVEAVVRETEPFLREVRPQRIHGDFHLGNVLWQQSGPLLVDFDDMVNGPCVQDIWLILPGRDEESREARRVLIEAYEELRAFDRATLALVEPLRALRIIHFSAWIARRWNDPAFKGVFVEFGTEKYWQEQIVALSECLELIREGRQA